MMEIKLREKYRYSASKKTQRRSGGTSGQAKPQGVLPVGIRRHPRGKTHYK